MEEAHRLTDHRPELSEEEKETLDRSLQKVLDDPGKYVMIKRFIPDPAKKGGSIATLKGRIRRLDTYHKLLFMEDGSRVPLSDILALQIEEQ